MQTKLLKQIAKKDNPGGLGANGGINSVNRVEKVVNNVTAKAEKFSQDGKDAVKEFGDAMKDVVKDVTAKAEKFSHDGKDACHNFNLAIIIFGILIFFTSLFLQMLFS
jgi:hypothetical protein